MPLQDYEEEMALVLEKMRASCKIRSPSGQTEEKEEPLTQSATMSSFGYTEILPHQDES